MLFKKKSNQDYDLVVLGGGSAAFAAAIRGSELGAQVAVIEEGVIGGTCVNRGCVPSKNLLHAAELYHTYRGNGFPGIPHGDTSISFREVIKQKTELVETMRRKKYIDILQSYTNIKRIEGKASFAGPNRVTVGNSSIEAERFIIATGARPAVPPIEGLKDLPYITYKEAMDLSELPRSMVIIGGGPIGLELGQVYGRFGTQVTILEMMPQIVPLEDPEISEALKGALQSEGIRIETGVRVVRITGGGKGVSVTVEKDGRSQDFQGEKLFVAAGLKPNSDGLNLDEVGVQTDKRGFITIDEETRTSAKSIWAVGDVTGRSLLVTTAAMQGGVAAKNALSGNHEKIDYSLTPHAIFTSPQVASVGLSEKEAKEQGRKVEVARISFEHVPKAGAIRDTRGLFKMVVDGKNYQILGVQIASEQAADLIHLGLFAIQKKMTVGDLVRTTFVYPTLSEVYKIAAISFKKDVTKLSCCAT